MMKSKQKIGTLNKDKNITSLGGKEGIENIKIYSLVKKSFNITFQLFNLSFCKFAYILNYLLILNRHDNKTCDGTRPWIVTPLCWLLHTSDKYYPSSVFLLSIGEISTQDFVKDLAKNCFA